MQMRAALSISLVGSLVVALPAAAGCAKRTVPPPPVYTGPVLTAVVPPIGDVSGSTLVTVYGARIGAPPQGVDFGNSGNLATALTAVSTGTTCLTPAGSAGAVDVGLTNNGQTSTLVNGFTYTTTTTSPTISAVSPSVGPEAGNDQFTITGSNFATSGSVSVWIGANAATSVTVVNSTTITARTPAGAANTTVNVAMANPDGGSITLVDGYQYVPSAVVQGISPPWGNVAGGDNVTITGRNFVNATSADLGGLTLTTLNVVSDAEIRGVTAARPAGVAVVNVNVTDPQGVGTLVNAFTYTDTPTVTNVAPNEALFTGGQTITVTGTNFVAGATVSFEGTLLQNVVVVNPTTITGDVPARAPAELDVTVTNVGNLAGTLTDGFYFIYPDSHQGAQFVWDTSAGIDHTTRWYLDFSHAILKSDLANKGLQSGTPADAVNNYVVDQLSAYICQGVNVMYGRNGDGTKVSGTSINITFAVRPPASGSPGGNTASIDFSRMCFGDNSGSSTIGRASLDTGTPCGNSSEDDCNGPNFPGGGTMLGVFIDSISASPSTLSPAIAQADQHFLDGSVTTGARYNQIQTYLLNYAYRVAPVAAHEIGHSVGLVANTAGTGSCGGGSGQCSSTGAHNNCCSGNIMRSAISYSGLTSFTARAFSGQPGGVSSAGTCATTGLDSWAMMNSFLGISP